MNIDLGSLFFNASIETGGGTPSWGTALGQSAPDYKLTYPGASDVLIAMDYCYCPLSDSLSCKLGKGGKEYKAIASQSIDSKYEITKAAIFYDVFIKVEERLISVDKPFILLVTRENENTHKGRRTLKYSDSTSVGEFSNKDFYDEVQVKLGGPNVCWFAYAIDVVDQSKLIVSVVKVSDTHESYANPEIRKRTWMSLLPTSMQASSSGQNFFFFNFSSSHTPTQIIYYGVPGCGKSYEVNKVINDELDKYVVTDKEYHKVRCVFHPEYCNADFVGQIYPYVKPDNGGVEYRFKPGPFAEIVRRAYRNPAEPFFLIIEEINRGNAAAIFGEIFQLLDRIRPEDGPEELSGNIYDTGWSSYGVTNIDVNAYVRQKSTDNPEKIEYDDSIPYGDKIKFINNTAIRLPPNLSIYATMNTSDQNVFTMDNAFQRRFKSKMIRNSLDNTAQFDLKIGDTGVRWGDFREWINKKILAPETGLKKAEDKCLGGWFIKGEKKTDQNGKVSNESKDFPKDEFAEKVLKYLWNDVFKRSAAENIFLKGKVSSLTNLIELFESGEKFAAFENVFVINAADKAKLLSQKNNP